MSEVVQEEDWKDKYFKSLLEQDDLEQEYSQRVADIYAETVHAFGHFQGKNQALDQALSNLPDRTKTADLSIHALREINRLIGDLYDQVSEEPPSRSAEAISPESYQKIFKFLFDQLPNKLTEKLNSKQLWILSNKELNVEQLLRAIGFLHQGVEKLIEDYNDQLDDAIEFIGEIAEKLDGLKTHFTDENNDSQSSLKNSKKLNRQVGNNLKKIRASFSDTDDINALKFAIEKHIDDIDRDVDSFAQSETERADLAQKNNEILLKQLIAFEEEMNTLRESLEEARSEASIDPLTQISNRRAYDERLKIEYARWKRNNDPLTLAIIDIDHFKKVNDQYGHPVGDKVLQLVASRIQQQVRESDFFGRIGGEEFVFMLVGTNVENSLEKINSLRKSIETCNFKFNDIKFQVTLSIGVAEFAGHDSIESVYNRADEALLMAKQTGRNRVLSEKDL